MRYFYIVWQCIHGTAMGNQAIMQMNPHGGLDIAAASSWLSQMHGEPVIITNWQEISLEQYNKFCEYVDFARRPVEPPKAPVLTLQKGGKHEPEKPASDRSPLGETGKRKDDDGTEPPAAG